MILTKNALAPQRLHGSASSASQRQLRAMPVCRAQHQQVQLNSQPVLQGVCAAIAAASLICSGPSVAAVPETTLPGTNAGFLSDCEIQQRRNSLDFIRSFDGKIALKDHRNGGLWDCKLDLKSPGTLLLRSPEGLVHYLAFSSLSQIDLSDDEVTGAIALSGWEKGVTPIEDIDDQKQVQRLELTREGFYGLVSIVEP